MSAGAQGQGSGPIRLRGALFVIGVLSFLTSVSGSAHRASAHASPSSHSRSPAAQPAALDTDDDGLPDAWETFFGLLPGDATDAGADPDADGLTNLQEYQHGSHPLGRFSRYFAEGSTGSFFDTSIGLINPSTTDVAHVSLAFLSESGVAGTHQVTLQPRQRQTVSVDDVLGAAGGAVGTVVESDVAIGADRLVTWGTNGYGSTVASGEAAPATIWYLAEGSTGLFEMYLLLLNPGLTPANVTVKYLREVGGPIAKTYTVPARSRATVFVNTQDLGLLVSSLGAVITSDVPIVAERAMYFSILTLFGAGTGGSGVPQLSTRWHFAEGATGPFFDEFLALLNPSTQPVTATVTYRLTSGVTLTKDYTIDPERRRTIYLNLEAQTDPALAPLADATLWVTVDSTLPIAAERVMWWPHTFLWNEGAASHGTIAPGTSFVVPEGSTGGPHADQTYALIANTSAGAGQVRLTLIEDSGAATVHTLPIGALQRLSVNVGAEFALGTSRFSLLVDSAGPSPVPLVVDYARYRSPDGVPFGAGGSTPAIPGAPADSPADAAPAVTATIPASNESGASTNANVTVTFSEPVNVTPSAFVLECPAGTPIALTNLTASPATTFILDPDAPLPTNEDCVLTVAATQVTDTDAVDPPDTMAADYVAAFETEAEATPAVSTTMPASGAGQVAAHGNVTLTFTEPVTVTGEWFQIACPTSGPRNVAATTVGGGPTVFTIDPLVDFAEGETCTVTVVAAQVADEDAVDPPDTMAADHVFSFTADVAPTIASTTPANGAGHVATTATVGVTFSEPVNVTGGWFQIACATSGPRDSGNTTVSGGPTMFVLDPSVNFAEGELCTVTVAAAQVRDQDAGDPPDTLALDHVFSFTVDTAPSVTATTPMNGAADLVTTATLAVTFSEPVDVTGEWFQIACGTSGPRAVGDTVVGGGPTIFTIDPIADFVAGETCTATVVAAQVTDQDAGDPPDTLSANHVVSFTIDAVPSVTTVTPADGATAATSAEVTIAFSEPVNVAGAWFQIACTTSGAHDPGNTLVTGGPTLFTLDPSGVAANETCTITVFAAQVTDQDGSDPPDTPPADFVSSFSTDAAPAVTATMPGNGATGQTIDTSLTVTFNEPVDVTGNWFQIACPTSGLRNPGATSVTGGPTTFTVNPTDDFAPGETCAVTVFATQVSDQDAFDPPDTPAANHVFTFTIDAAPLVTTTSPANAETNVLPSSNITVNFDESVNATTSAFLLTCDGGAPLPYALSPGTPSNTFTLNPAADLTGTSCTVTVQAAQVTDADSADPPNTMAANHVFSFTLEQAPAVTSTVPVHNAVGVATSQSITINFSEPVTASGASFGIDCQTGSPWPFSVSGSPGAAITLTPTGGLPAGTICTVTVLAGGIADVDAADPPDGLAAPHVFSFSLSPIANADSRGAIGHVTVDSSTGSMFTIVANDLFVLPLTTVSVDSPSANGGTVTVTGPGPGQGQFVYTPPVGFSGTDAFNYTIANAAGSATSTLTFTVSTPIWFIDNDPGACSSGCDGRQATPFPLLSAFQAINNGAAGNPAAGHHIFVHESGTPYSGGVTLLAGQRLIGQDASAGLLAITGHGVLPDGSSVPGMNLGNGTFTTMGGTVRVDSGAVVRGLRISTSGQIGMDDPAAAAANVTVDEVAVSSTGAPGVSFTSLTGSTLTFTSIASSGAVNGIALSGTTGSFTIVGTGAPNSGGTIQNTIGDGISLTNAANVSLSRIHVLNAGRHGIFGTGVTNFTLSDSAITGAGDAPGEHGLAFGTLDTNNLLGTALITGSTISGMHQHGITVENVSGTLTLTVTDTTIQSNDSLEGGDGILFQAGGTATAAADMTLTVNETTASGCVFQNLAGDAIQVNSEANGTAGSITRLNVDGCAITNVGGGNAALFIGGINGSINRGFFDIRNNTLTGVALVGIAAMAADDSELEGSIVNNTVDTIGGEGMVLFADGGVFATPSPVLRATVRGNNVNGGTDIAGIRVNSRDGTGGSVHLQFEGNTIAVPVDGGFGGGHGIILRAEDGMNMCIDVIDQAPLGVNNSSGGTNEGGGSGLVGYRVDNMGTGVVTVEGLGGAVPAHFTANSNVGSVLASGTIVAGTCTTPP